MDDKKQILQQLGWSGELIEQCLHPNNRLTTRVPQPEYQVLIASEQDISDVVIGIDTPVTSDGTRL